VATIEERVKGLEQRVGKMDMELKEHFDDQQRFISGALAGLEKRLVEKLGEQITGVEERLGARVDKMDRDMHAAFAGMDSKLSVLIELARDTRTQRSRRR